MPALLPIIPAIGAVILRIFRSQSTRGHWIVAVALSAGWVASAILMHPFLPVEVSLSTWRPLSVYQGELGLNLDLASWSLALTTALILLSVILTSPARPGSANPVTRQIAFAYGGLVMAAVLSSNLLTVAITWAAADVFSYVVMMREAETIEAVEGLTARLRAQVVSSTLVIAAAIVRETPLVGQAGNGIGLLLALAVLFRVGLWPLHIELPPLPGVRRGMGALMRFYPPLMGLAVLGRFFPQSLPSTAVAVLILLAAVSVVAGGIRWITAKDVVEERPFLVLTLSGAAVAAGTAGGQTQLVSALAASLILAGFVLSSLRLHGTWLRYVGMAAGLIAAGAPFTASHAGLIFGSPDSTVESIGALGLMATLVLLMGHIGLFAGSISSTRSTLIPWESAEPFARQVFGLGLTTPLVGCLIIGLAVPTRPTFVSVSLFVAIVGVAAAISTWLARRPSVAIAKARHTVGEITISTRQGLAAGLSGLWSGGAALMRTATGAVEGRGAMLWVYVVLMVIAVLLGSVAAS